LAANNASQPPLAAIRSMAKRNSHSLKCKTFGAMPAKKMHRGKEMFDYIGASWDLLPATGQVATHSITVNFPPDLERVTKRLSFGQVQHDRKDIRHPETTPKQTSCKPTPLSTPPIRAAQSSSPSIKTPGKSLFV
jgi:hypothetical protein